jgi:CheY-like chemotaxis protein
VRRILLATTSLGTLIALSPTRVLIADDDPDIRELLRLSLAGHYDVVMARDGLEAWRLFESEAPRLVVSDLNMPGLNGLEFTDRIRAHPERGDTPVIILTGTTRNSDLAPAFWRMATQADAFLEKPVTPDQLLAEIRRQLMRRATPIPLPPGKGYY